MSSKRETDSGANDPSGEESPASDLVELVLADHERSARRDRPTRIDGVVIGTLHSIAADGRAMVELDEWPGEPVAARAMLPFGADDVGRPCALLFEGCDPSRPVLMGWMFEAALPRESAVATPTPPPDDARVVERNGERLVFEADQEIVLKCGRASITLTRAGKILIRGAYLLARSSGVNRIQGGSVQIN